MMDITALSRNPHKNGFRISLTISYMKTSPLHSLLSDDPVKNDFICALDKIERSCRKAKSDLFGETERMKRHSEEADRNTGRLCVPQYL